MLSRMWKIVYGECRKAAVTKRHGSVQPRTGTKENRSVTPGTTRWSR
jgi:hypothetical protein